MENCEIHYVCGTLITVTRNYGNQQPIFKVRGGKIVDVELSNVSTANRSE